MNLTRSAYLARIGKVSIAKQVLQSVLHDNTENTYAREMMAALSDAP